MLTIGLDVHLSRTSVCILDAKGNTLRQQEIKGGFEALADTLAKLKEPFQVCYEASTGYGALYERISAVAQKIQVAHPGRLRLIFKSKRKNNKADAQKLAALMHLNQVPQVYVPAQEIRSWRGLIEHRRRLVDRSVSLKSQVRALLRNCGIKGKAGRSLWTKAGLEWLRQTPWPTKLEQLRLELLLEQLEELRGKIDRITDALDPIAAADKRVELLMTIPGVGPRTAETFVAYVDDPHRFSSGTIGAYFGLIPREDSTGDHRRLGHITKEGPSTMRKLLTEATWRGVSGSPKIQAVFQRHLQGDKHRRKLALVATAHWLCRIMLAMLKRNEVFRESDQLPQLPE